MTPGIPQGAEMATYGNSDLQHLGGDHGTLREVSGGAEPPPLCDMTGATPSPLDGLREHPILKWMTGGTSVSGNPQETMKSSRRGSIHTRLCPEMVGGYLPKWPLNGESDDTPSISWVAHFQTNCSILSC